MKLFLVQHGKPLTKEEDPDRPLSKEGRNDVEIMALFMLRAGVRPHRVFHSGKTRALQTARIFSSTLSCQGEPIEKKGLSPKDNVRFIFEEIQKAGKDVLVVGHLPHLGRLAALMTAGDEIVSVAGFQQGSVMCLEKPQDSEEWHISWMLTPEVVNPNMQ